MCSHPSNERKWKPGKISPPNSRHCNRKSGTTNWRQIASLLNYIIPSDTPKRKGRGSGTNSSGSSTPQPAVFDPAALSTSPRRYAWALLRHQRRLIRATMPSKIHSPFTILRRCIRSVLDTFFKRPPNDFLNIELPNTLALTNFKFQVWNATLCNLLLYIWSLTCSPPPNGRNLPQTHEIATRSRKPLPSPFSSPTSQLNY